MAAFTASKNAVDSLIRSLAHEFAGDGLRLNSLVLASLKTKKVRASKPHGDYAHFIAPQEIVPIVHFLMSSASMLVNGNSIDVYRYSKDFYRRGYFERVSQ
jgi:NAD(P)-dependent dehydrogenase (short-subunit alcohol dehydrogenase family)